jgi:6-phosphofructokinase 1
MDRVRAVRFSVKSIQHIEKFASMTRDEIANDPMSCAIIGISGAQVRLSSMEQIENEETDWKHRRPKHEYWSALTGLGDVLAGRPRKSDSEALNVPFMPV